MASQQEHPDKDKYPQLPKLKIGAGRVISSITRSGTWEARGAKELDQIAKSLDVEKRAFNVNAVPDIWARLITFRIGLLSINHALSGTIIGEWRGLLAAIALQEFRRFPLEMELVEIPAPPQPELQSSNPRERRKREPNFLSAATKLLPSQSLMSIDDWTKLHVILLQGEPIGVTSPMTLVCTATDYRDRVTGIPWFKNGLFVNPVHFLNGREKEALAWWLDRAGTEITRIKAQNDEPMGDWNTVQGLLDQFILELGGVQERAFMLSVNSFFDEVGVRHFISRPIEARGVPTEPDVELVPPSKNPKDRLLIVDENIARQWGLAQHEIIVWEGQTLDTVLERNILQRPTNSLSGVLLVRNLVNNPDAEPGIAGDRVQYTVWPAAGLLTEKLFVVRYDAGGRSDDRLPGVMKSKGSDQLAHKGGQVVPIPPLQPVLLDYFTPKELAERIEYVKSGQSVKVKLTLTLRGPIFIDRQTGRAMRKPVDFIVEKTYDFETRIHEIEGLPIIGIWPFLKVPGWRIYHALVADDVGSLLSVDFPERLRESSQGFTEKTLMGDQIPKKARIVKMSEYPEALLCTISMVNADDRRIQQIPGGLLLLRQPSVPLRADGIATIGIDFGTSNTQAFVRMGDEPIGAAKLQDRLQIVVRPDNSNRLTGELFVPNRDIELPIQSLFRCFHDEVKGQELGANEQPNIEAFLDGNIYFFDSSDEITPLVNSVKSNMKWGGMIDRAYQRAFLHQLCLHCAAEIAAKGFSEAQINYSYPSSYAGRDLEDIRRSWNVLKAKIVSQTGIKIGEPRDYTESISVSLYFRGKMSAPLRSTGTVCLDIGGETSDIALWVKGSEEAPVEASVRFAGRALLINPLQQCRGLLRTLGLNDAYNFVERHSGLGEIPSLERALAKDFQALRDKLSISAGNKSVVRFQQLLGLGMSGLFYYCGAMMRAVAQDDDSKFPEAFYVGGNGSRILHLIAHGEFTESSTVSVLLQKSFQLGLGKSISPLRIKLSQNPKQEVAYGLLVAADPEEGIAFRGGEHVTLVSGEPSNLVPLSMVSDEESGEQKVTIRNQIHEWEPITYDDIRRGIRFPAQLPKLREFINSYVSLAPNMLGDYRFNQDSYDQAANQVSDQFLEWQNVGHADLRIEPPFVIGLKKYFKLEVEKWASDFK